MGIDGTVTSTAPNTLTNFPFYRGGVGHWGIQGLGTRWECDDYPNGFSSDTLHRVWIR